MFQFIRIEAYSDVSGLSKQLGKKSAENSAERIRPSIQQVIDEAFRVEHASPHVPNPSAPKLLFGLDQKALESHLNQLKTTGRDRIGRRVRKDALLLLAGVASYPKAEADADKNCYERWLALTQQYLKTKYGNNLQSILLHTDEANPHLHFFCTPTQKPSGEIAHISTIHDGIRASEAIKTASSKVKKYAYDKAMRSYQQEYHKEVGLKIGMTRIGPSQTGMPRRQWIRTKEDAKRQAVFIENQNKAEIMNNIANTKAAELDARAQQLETQQLELDSKIAAIAERENKISARESDLDTKQKTLVEFYISIKNALDSKGQSLVDFFQKSVQQLNEIIAGHKCTIAQLKEEVKHWHQKYIQSVDSVKYSDPELTVQRYELYKATVANDNKTFRQLSGLIRKNEIQKAEQLIEQTLNRTRNNDL